jgi:soluble lytic murein transglycosylase-like protein
VSPTTFFLCMVMIQMDYTYTQTRQACEAMPLVERSSYNNDLDPGLVLSIIHVESSWRPNSVSARGACGLMQLVPTSHPTRSGKVYTCKQLQDPKLNIRLGVESLRGWIDLADGDISLALCAYHSGVECFEDPHYHYVEKVVTVYGRIMSEIITLGGPYGKRGG